jgi:hypothetical protein
MIPYLAQLLDITVAIIPRDWEKGTVVPIYKGGDNSMVSDYRPKWNTS